MYLFTQVLDIPSCSPNLGLSYNSLNSAVKSFTENSSAFGISHVAHSGRRWHSYARQHLWLVIETIQTNNTI